VGSGIAAAGFPGGGQVREVLAMERLVRVFVTVSVVVTAGGNAIMRVGLWLGAARSGRMRA
jgi:hypothetical protein